MDNGTGLRHARGKFTQWSGTSGCDRKWEHSEKEKATCKNDMHAKDVWGNSNIKLIISPKYLTTKKQTNTYSEA